MGITKGFAITARNIQTVNQQFRKITPNYGSRLWLLSRRIVNNSGSREVWSLQRRPQGSPTGPSLENPTARIVKPANIAFGFSSARLLLGQHPFPPTYSASLI